MLFVQRKERAGEFQPALFAGGELALENEAEVPHESLEASVVARSCRCERHVGGRHTYSSRPEMGNGFVGEMRGSGVRLAPLMPSWILF